MSAAAPSQTFKIYGIDLPVSLSSLIWGIIMLISALLWHKNIENSELFCGSCVSSGLSLWLGGFVKKQRLGGC